MKFLKTLVAPSANEQLAKLILHGENYVAMSLADAAQEYFAATQDVV